MLFVASHSTKELHNPIFEYRFSNGTVSYNDDDKTIIGKLNDGTIKEYGTFLFVEGLDELMLKCYNEEKLPSEYKDFEKLVDC